MPSCVLVIPGMEVGKDVEAMFLLWDFSVPVILDPQTGQRKGGSSGSTTIC